MGALNDLKWTDAVELASPHPYVLATTVDADGTPNIIGIGWFTIVSWSPAMACISVADQDYRVEVYWEPEAGKVLHGEAIWRHMDIGVMSFDSEDIQRLVLNGLADWDAQTEVICADGGP